MARSPENVNIWQDARVWLSLAATRPDLPTDADTAVTEGPFATGWGEFGILDGEAGFGEERTFDETEHYGWGIGLIKIGSRNFKLNRTFSALEDNEATRAVLWPGSTESKLLMPKPVYAWLGFDTTSDTGTVERLFTVSRARLTVPNNNRNESDITRLEITANIFGKSVGDDIELFDRQVSGAAPVTP